MKALETEYKGFRFRSRLEARWAVFMDVMGVKYEYEREAYELDGLCYLPDFWLPQKKVHLEIKPEEPTEDETEKAFRLAKFTSRPVYIIFGAPEIPWPNNQEASESAHMIIAEGWDCSHWWCECPHCNRCELQYNGRADRIKCGCEKSAHGDKGYNYNSPKLRWAYAIAKSYRFDPVVRNGVITPV